MRLSGISFPVPVVAALDILSCEFDYTNSTVCASNACGRIPNFRIIVVVDAGLLWSM